MSRHVFHECSTNKSQIYKLIKPHFPISNYLKRKNCFLFRDSPIVPIYWYQYFGSQLLPSSVLTVKSLIISKLGWRAIMWLSQDPCSSYFPPVVWRFFRLSRMSNVRVPYTVISWLSMVILCLLITIFIDFCFLSYHIIVWDDFTYFPTLPLARN